MGEKQEMESDDREDGSTIESKSAAADRLKSFHLLELALSIDTATNRKREQRWRTKSWRRGTTTRSVLRKNRWEVSCGSERPITTTPAPNHSYVATARYYLEYTAFHN